MRLEHVYGPNDGPSKFIPFLVDQLCSVRPVTLPLTLGHQKRDFIYVNDVVNAYLVLFSEFEVTQRLPNLTEFEIGTGNATPISEVARLIKSFAKSSTELGYGILPGRENEIQESFADCRFRETFQWSPTTSLENGLDVLVKEACGEL